MGEFKILFPQTLQSCSIDSELARLTMLWTSTRLSSEATHEDRLPKVQAGMD
jgi:hypothetical protein